MYTLKFRKSSAAAIAAALATAGAGVSHAAQISPYNTGFEPAGGTPSAVYNPGAIVGQNGWLQDAPGATGTVVNLATGSFNTAGAFSGNGPLGTQSLRLTSITASGASSDFYTTTVSGNGPGGTPADAGSPLVPGVAPYTGIVTVAFNEQLASPNSSTRTGESTGTNRTRGGFGMDVLSPNGTDIASIYLRPDNLTPGQANVPLVEATTTGNGSLHVIDVGAADDTWGSYSLRLDFTTGKFFAYNGNVQYGPFPLNLAGGSTIGEIGLAADNIGADTAFFDNLTVTAPEPAGIMMVSVGTLLLLAKRPKRLA